MVKLSPFFQVIPQVDGLICYMDATCTCARTGCSSEGQHSLDVLELEAMLRTVPPHLTPPVLVLLARLDNPTASSSDSDHDVDSFTASTSTPSSQMETQPATRHRPAMLHPVLRRLDLPWAVSNATSFSLKIKLTYLTV